MSEYAYRDDFYKDFDNIPDFIAFLQEREMNSQWFNYETSALTFHPLESGNEIFDDLEAIFDPIGKKGVISDTIKHTALVAEVNGNYTPIRITAIKTILERAAIGGNALKKVSKSVLARIITDCLAVQKGKSLIRLSEDKISAVHSGDDSYSILPIPELFDKVGHWLEVNYPGCHEFRKGTYEHSLTSGLWEIVGDDELVYTYVELLERYGVPHMTIRPALKLISSDTAASGANLYPMLYNGVGKYARLIPLGYPLKVIHKKTSIEDFEKNLNQVYSQYSLAIGKLQELLDIDIRNPANCLGYVMKELRIPKKMAMEVIEKFKVIQGANPSTAHDLYYALNEVVSMLLSEGESGYRVAMMEETVSRALNIRWKEFDIPGDFKW